MVAHLQVITIGPNPSTQVAFVSITEGEEHNLTSMIA